VSDGYARYRKALEEAGVPQADIDKAVAEQQRQSACIDRRECPSCRGPMTRVRDPRQVGPVGIRGVWYNYRCVARCGGRGAVIDRAETGEQN
jgi:hypothetical protein